MNIIGCVLILKDDFNNILVLKKKVKRGQKEIWSLLNSPLKGKKDCEKTLSKAANKSLKTVLFELKEFKEFSINEEEAVKVYTGVLRERYVLEKSYDDANWINKNNLEKYEFGELDNRILNEYFK
ncbi:hypothetical protein [Clostridium taeniosporum]|uniref:NUDIX hydrolase n=1 Tax=Clostridium taeniosporum TaxID=394958 RepID=A0A1D7XKV9_9CLOT|nr:hypothetical protein [Clostridium taeniosporum]AOR23810.1 hypothetical protein BGI42_08755 [Clostridium taeniosporum]